MRTALPASAARRSFGLPVVRLGRLAFHHLFSFEAALALFVYSNTIKFFLPRLPVDETALFGLLAVGAGGIVVLRHGLYIRGLPIVAAFLAFLGWTCLSALWTPSTVNAKAIVTFMLIFELPCLLLATLILAGSRERTIRFIGFVLAMSAGIAAYSWFIDLVYGNFRFYRGFGDFPRMYLNWGYAAANGGIIAFALLVASRTFSARQIAAALLFGLCAGFLLIGSGRGPLLSVVAACLLAIMVGFPELGRGQIRIPRWQLIALMVLILGVAVILVLSSGGVEFYTFRFFTKLLNQLAETEEMVEAGGVNRFVFFAAAIQFWLQAPIVGNGVGSFSLMLHGEERPGAFPHNIILETLCSLGLVGLVLLLVFVWMALRHAGLGRLRRDPLLLCVAMLLVGRTVSAMVSGNLGDHEQMFMLLGLLALRAPPLAAARSARTAGSPAPETAGRGGVVHGLRGARRSAAGSGR